MSSTHTIEQLAEAVNQWCDQNEITPANGQSGVRMTERNVRYYRTLGLLDAPLAGGGTGYGEKHLFQLIGIRLLQAQGLPLTRIRELLFGRTLDELRQIEKRGLDELKSAGVTVFRPTSSESWTMTPLDDEFILVSRQGRGISQEMCARLRSVLHPSSKPSRPRHHITTKE